MRRQTFFHISGDSRLWHTSGKEYWVPKVMVSGHRERGTRMTPASRELNMSQNPMRTLSIAGAVAMVGLNVTVVAFFVLWLIADSAAIRRMETESNMDPGQMLPNSELMWLAAHGSLLMVVVLDVLAVALLVMTNGVPPRLMKHGLSRSETGRCPSRSCATGRYQHGLLDGNPTRSRSNRDETGARS